jgi:hypothetical protein
MPHKIRLQKDFQPSEAKSRSTFPLHILLDLGQAQECHTSSEIQKGRASRFKAGPPRRLEGRAAAFHNAL